MELQYNGHAYSKRFTREMIMVMCADARKFYNPAVCIDWRRSSRRCLRVRDARMLELLQSCNRRYFWPDGKMFWCRARKRRPSPQQMSTPHVSVTCEDELEHYAKTHGYDYEEDGEILPTYNNLKSVVVC